MRAYQKMWYTSTMNSSDLYTIALGERGRLIVTVDAEGGFRAVPAREQARRLCGLYRDLAPGRSLVDELLAERRREARQEESP